MRRVVVGKLGDGEEIGPIVLLIVAIHPYVSLQRLVKMFCSAVGLRVVT
jgi:hypothetical protein